MRRIFFIIILITMLLTTMIGHIQVSAANMQDSATILLEKMTPEERIGQLFIVTFKGSTLAELEDVIKLIKEHHISGVVLREDFDNFIDAPNTLSAASELIATLQTAEYESSLEPSLIDQTSPSPKKPEYIPLLIAISQEGGGYPYSQILSGITHIPSQMAIGATWQPNLAKSVAQVLGSELKAIGFNLLLGPSLDVLEDPRIIGPGDIGVRSFGGDPYWVSLMGKAYIEGIHEGSEGRVGVIAKHFPGLGGADRPSSEEIATVRKSISQLQQIDLVPFFNVAKSSPGTDLTTADGFLISNVRYQGFQGNIRATTRPVGLDREAYAQLMSLEELVDWREGGGLTMSDALGSRAIRRFIESLGQNYKGHLVAKDAFLAGNDLLYLADVKSDDDPDEATTIRSTLAFFAQKYREDAVFAQRVDEAVLRILKFKLRIYDNRFDINLVLPSSDALQEVGGNGDITIEVARNAASLISPTGLESENRIGNPPNTVDRIIFFTDSRAIRQCTTCQVQINPSITVMQDTITRLYGSRGAGQVGEWNLSSYSMTDLANYMGLTTTETIQIPAAVLEELEENLVSADWIVFSILKSSSDVYGSEALKWMLDSRQDLFIDKKIIVFSHDVPYDLDATDISKIDVYYALYDNSAPFYENAARLLFQEVTANGDSPVSVPGIGYDLIEVTSPDPDQVITFTISKEAEGLEGATPEVGETQELFQVGDIIKIETGVIIDKNGHPVPDGTPVEFIMTFQVENIPSLELSSTTKNGMAKINTTLDRPGIVSINVESSLARVSEVKQITIQGEAVEGTPVEPIAMETELPEQTETIEPSPVPSEAMEQEQATPMEADGEVAAQGFLLGVAGIVFIGGMAYSVTKSGHPARSSRIRFTIVTIIGGLIGYNYLAFSLPGSESLVEKIGNLANLFTSIAGGGLALILVLLIGRRESII
jgi:beta-N-acetylhexosaminidase